MRYCASSSSSDKADHCFLSKWRIRDQKLGYCLALCRVRTVNCEEIHSGRLQTTDAYKASAEQLIIEQMIEKLNNFHDR